LRMVSMGFSVFAIGTVAVLGGLAAALKNYVAGVVLMLAVMALLLSGTIGMGLEYFYVLLVAVVLTLAAGMVVRWITS
jgi:hypothetical protein